MQVPGLRFIQRSLTLGLNFRITVVPAVPFLPCVLMQLTNQYNLLFPLQQLRQLPDLRPLREVMFLPMEVRQLQPGAFAGIQQDRQPSATVILLMEVEQALFQAQ
jgi:hypothetical protein